MHELSICQSIRSQVEHIAADHQARRIVRIKLQIGPLSGVEATLLEQAFPLAMAGSVAATATLEVEFLPIRVVCQTCGKTSEASANRLLCGECGDWHTQLVSGDELLLASVELDQQIVPDYQPHI